MDENDLKKYTVILGDGSGILFQPLNSERTYILSAKHVFYNKIENDRGIATETLKKEINLSFSDSQQNKNKLEIKKGENYFEHANEKIDAAIFITDGISGFNQIYTEENISNFSNFNLTGYPESRRPNSEKYNKYRITDLISSNSEVISLRLEINYLTHGDITGFSGGGIIRTNKDSILLAGIQSKTPEAECNGEINIVPIIKFQEIIIENNLDQLIPSYLSKITELIEEIIKLDNTNINLKPKLNLALKFQLNQIKLNLVDIYKSNYIEKSCTSKFNKKTKHFWIAFLEYALIISLIEENALDDQLLSKVIREKKFMFSDSEKNVYEMFSEILIYASDDIEDECQILLGSTQIPNTKKTRRILAKDIPRNITLIDDEDSIDRVLKSNKIKEVIHLKAIEFDCINENEEHLNTFSLEQFNDILKEIKKIVYDFFQK